MITQTINRGGLSKNTFYDESFLPGNFRLFIQEISTCLIREFIPTDTRYCENRVSFFFEISCEDLLPGNYKGEIKDHDTDEIYKTDIPINIS